MKPEIKSIVLLALFPKISLNSESISDFEALLVAATVGAGAGIGAGAEVVVIGRFVELAPRPHGSFRLIERPLSILFAAWLLPPHGFADAVDDDCHPDALADAVRLFGSSDHGSSSRRKEGNAKSCDSQVGDHQANVLLAGVTNPNWLEERVSVAAHGIAELVVTFDAYAFDVGG